MKRIFIFLGLFVMLFATSANTGGIDHSWVPTIYQPAIVEVEPKPVKEGWTFTLNTTKWIWEEDE